MKKVKELEKQKFYSLEKINSKNCEYNLIIGERSNGKTFACLKQALDLYLTKGIATAYIRRWSVDLVGKRSAQLFSSVLETYDLVGKTQNKYNEIYCVSNKWYLSYYDKEKKKRYYDTEPFCFGFSLSEMEHEKGVSYPSIKHIIFDEFLTRTTYLKDEFILFMNVLSTIIRNKNDVKIYMLGNTVNKFSPYFTEMGLKNVENQKQGTIDLYRFGNDNVHINIAVEYCCETETKKESNKYFCFGNERLEMITGGKWELAAYPTLPYKYEQSDILYIFYIKFGDNILQGNVLCINNNLIIYIHVKTSLIGIDSNERIVFDLVSNPKPNYFRKLLNNSNKICSTITYLFSMDKVYYQNNTVGDIVRNYLLQSMKNNLTI